MKQCAPLGFMRIKLDMSKVYDQVKWGFLKAVMKKMGFAAGWIKLVMECIRTVTWTTGGQYHSVERVTTRGPAISLSISFVCRGIEFYA